MLQLVLLRHGQSVWNLEDRFTGRTDVDLFQTKEFGRPMRRAGCSRPKVTHLTSPTRLSLNGRSELYGSFWIPWISCGSPHILLGD